MIHYRPIEIQDNPAIARVIRTALEEFDVNKPGTVYTDPTTDHLYELFQQQGSCYWIALKENEIIGGCGIYPTAGLPNKCAELVKLYLNSDFRGLGIGKELMELIISSAKKMGYNSLYLESLPELNQAIHLYEKMGFIQRDSRLGDSGHFACNLWMTLELTH